MKYYKVIDNNANVTFVYFSAVNTMKGKFTFYKSSQSVDGNYIFLNSDSDWYLNGVPGLGNTLNETVEALTNIIVQLNTKTLVLVGDSMGAYGAMLFSSLIEFPGKVRVLAIAPELTLNVQGGISIRHLSDSVKAPEILDRIKEKENLEITVVVGKACHHDLIGLLPFVSHIRVITYENSFHAVSLLIDSRTGLANFIRNWYQDTLEIPVSYLNCNIIKLFHQVSIGNYDFEKSSIDALLCDTTLEIEDLALSYYISAKYHHYHSHFELAKRHIDLAIRLNPNNYLFLDNHLLNYYSKSNLNILIENFSPDFIRQPVYLQKLNIIVNHQDVDIKVLCEFLSANFYVVRDRINLYNNVIRRLNE